MSKVALKCDTCGNEFNKARHEYNRKLRQGKDKFYFSNGHDIQSDSMNLAHATLKYLLEQYELSIWGRNILDETYKTRGFYFGNNPLNGWINEPYYQFGEPRTLGITARIHF